MQTRPAERSAGAEVQAEKELIRCIRLGEVRSHEGVRLWRRTQAQKDKPIISRELRSATKSSDGGENSVAALGGSTITTQQEELALNRCTDAVLQAYGRLVKPENDSSTWSPERWAALAQVFAKLRGLAAAARWRLAQPGKLLSQDAKVLFETGIDDPVLAGQTVDNAEGLIEARLIRIAVCLAGKQQKNGKEKFHKVEDSWLSPEVSSLARITLTHVRSIGTDLERLIDGSEEREVVLAQLGEVYSALAAGLECLRKRISNEAGRMLEAAQDPLWAAATAATSLGLAKEQAKGYGHGWSALKAKLSMLHGSRAITHNRRDGVKSDSFTPLHQATLLSHISSFAEMGSEPPGGPETENQNRVKRLIDAVLSSPDGAELSTLDAGLRDLGDESEPSSELEPWRVEFTSSQLRAMQKAIDSGQPQISGGLALLRDTLDGYAQLAGAVGLAYSSEKVLRANPAEISRHQGLVQLVGKLQANWRDAGAVLQASRQADLLALEKVRLRHNRLVQRAFRAGGQEVAAIVLARLALVDEMLLPASERRVTGELPFSMKRPYELCQKFVSGIHKAGQLKSHRRRRWLRCPHANVQVVVAGEVWRQVMERYLSIDPAFEAVNACVDLPISLREFRVAACLMELNLNERLAGLVYEMLQENAGGNGDVTLFGLQKFMSRLGPRGCGEWSLAAEAAGVQVRIKSAQSAAAAAGMSEKVESNNKTQTRRRALSKTLILKLEQEPPPPKSDDKPKAIPMVCPRCLRGIQPTFPYVSLGELIRQHGACDNRSDASSDTGGRMSRPVSSLRLESSTSLSARTGSSLGSSDDESESLAGGTNSHSGTELGEDTVVSWATAVLTDGILLCKDERGAYFRWLARIVLYNVHDDVADEEQKAMSPIASGVDASKGAQKTSAGRRMSFASALSAGLPTIHSDHENSEEDQPSKKMVVDTATDFATVAQLAARKEAASSKEKALRRRRADELEEVKEMDRDNALTMPDAHLACMRVDLGIVAPKNKAGDEGSRVLTAGDSNLGQQMTMAEKLLKIFQENVDTQKLRRADREANMLQGLKLLSISPQELRFFQKELAVAAELPPNSTGAILVGGAAQAAQRMLMPNQVMRKPVERTLEKDDKAEMQRALKSLRESSASSGTASAASPPGALKSLAKEILDNSGANASRCYGRVGFDEEARKSKVAVALRLLEHELFNAEEADDTVGEDDDVSRVAPLVLPKLTSERLVQLARWEQQELEQAAQAEATKTEPERRKARVLTDEVKKQSPPSSRAESISPRSDQADSGHSKSSTKGKRTSDNRVPLTLLRPPPSPSSHSPSPPKPRTPKLSQSVSETNISTALGNQQAASTWIAGQFAQTQVQWSDSDWHPSVQSLLDSVSIRGQRMRATTQGFGFGRTSKKSFSRSASDSGLLPAVTDETSPLRGNGASSGRASAKGYARQSKKDRILVEGILVEGWRAKTFS
eukprot:TRINITY_DN12185_c0_g1_i1.p1 TRINITY_DN12185_c0_g1~~TRINITY_DN12185_c0_g1_i1.p1  ORF type:complete len:1460 (-),score=285.62 TRINITY_DN12185_c0_g1_i1:209-4588(-)